MDTGRIRGANISLLRRRGFRVAPSLPLERGKQALRPTGEIAARLMALDALFTWVCYPPDDVATSRVEQYIARNDLLTWMTPSERAIASTERAAARDAHIDDVGWRLENMWPLAWVLGFELEPDVDGEMIDWETVTRPMLNEFLAGLEKTVDDQVRKSRCRTLEEVMELEDRFYCAHNAVRSAQLGAENAVPPGICPLLNGGVIHERRQALTWCLSPAVQWDDTDLST
jgi:hypothetical protein